MMDEKTNQAGQSGDGVGKGNPPEAPKKPNAAENSAANKGADKPPTNPPDPPASESEAKLSPSPIHSDILVDDLDAVLINLTWQSKEPSIGEMVVCRAAGDPYVVVTKVADLPKEKPRKIGFVREVLREGAVVVAQIALGGRLIAGACSGPRKAAMARGFLESFVFSG